MNEDMVAAGLREPVFVPDAFFRAIFHRSPEFSMKETILGVEAPGRKPNDPCRSSRGANGCGCPSWSDA
ncbi:MAG: hypothetical protein AB1512_31740 [Thermodesulfobacteriota bacterium]